MENQRSQIEIVRTQKVLSNYIEFKKDTKKFTKYVEGLNGKSNKKNNRKDSGEK